MNHMQTDWPILKNKRAVIILSVGIVLAGLSLMGGWAFFSQPAYMNYFPSKKPGRSRMRRKNLGFGYSAEHFYKPTAKEGVFQHRRGDTLRFEVLPLEESTLAITDAPGTYHPNRWAQKLQAEGELTQYRYVRHPHALGAELLYWNEDRVDHYVALVEGSQEFGQATPDARVLLLHFTTTPKAYADRKALINRTIATLLPGTVREERRY